MNKEFATPSTGEQLNTGRKRVVVAFSGGLDTSYTVMKLKEEGYDYSYIHYTAVAPWYEKLGYETIIKWNAKGIIR